MYRYRAVELPGKWEKHTLRTPYGLLAETDVCGKWEIVAVTADISCEKPLVERLAETCTRRQLDPARLMDVIMDGVLSPSRG